MKKIMLYFVIFIILIQLIQTDKNNQKMDFSLEVKTDDMVKKILKKSCYDCHSQQTKYPFYSYIAPFSWVISSNIKNGRKALDFSKWKNIDKGIKIERLKRMKKVINNSMMPKFGYLIFHPKAKLNQKEIKVLDSWTVEELKKYE